MQKSNQEGWLEKYEKKIPVILAGGIYEHTDYERAFTLGADGVQIATRFVTTEECDADERYKQAYIQAKKEDPEHWECCRKCGNHVPYLSSYRDPDEGMCGPVYEACPDCVSKFYQSYEDECEWLDDEYY